MVDIPTTQENVDASRSFLETALSQTSALNDKSFIEVMARLQGMTKTELYHFVVERLTQYLATEATGDDLVKLAKAYGLEEKQGTKASLLVRITGEVGIEVPATSSWKGISNGIRYFQNIPFTVGASGYADVTINADDIGVSGNLQDGSTVEFLSAVTVDGLSSEGYVQSTTIPGSDKEEEEELRIRLIDRLRVETGGSNGADVRLWSQESPNVYRAYPYSGNHEFVDSEPGYRVVYIQTRTSYDPDGYADQTVLDDVRDKITTDSTTGRSNQSLGSIDDLLDVRSISRRSFYFTIDGMSDIDESKTESAKEDIATALDEYKSEIIPFIEGLDATFFRNDTITSVSASERVQDVLRSYGGYAVSVKVGVQPGAYVASYTLQPGELIDITDILYV